jgi:amino acid transporter
VFGVKATDLAKANYVAGDMKNPQRDLPRAIHTAMAIVIVGFAALVSTLYLVMGFDAVRATSTPIVVRRNPPLH